MGVRDPRVQASRAAVTRYAADGTVDPTFGTAGSAAFPNDLRNAGVDVAADPGGGVFLSAVPRTGPGANGAVVVRFTAAGVIDTAFGDQGFAVTGTSSDLRDVPVRFVVNAADGSIFVAIVPSDGQHSMRPAVAKFSRAGQLDLGYGSAGYAFWPSTDVISVGAMDVALDGVGRVLLAFACPDLTVTRFNATGHPDLTFGSEGAMSVGHSVSDSGGSSISVTADADHGVLVGLEINGHATVLRLSSDGTRDAYFGGDDSHASTGFGTACGVTVTAVESAAVYIVTPVRVYRIERGTQSPTQSVPPTVAPTASPSASPTISPTGSPTGSPTIAPSISPTTTPTSAPTRLPTSVPSASPTASPTVAPSVSPTIAPSTSPSITPTWAPTGLPTSVPSRDPSTSPTTMHPTAIGETFSPTQVPTLHPTASPTSGAPTKAPTTAPTSPTTSPTMVPTALTGSPTTAPTAVPSAATLIDQQSSSDSADPGGGGGLGLVIGVVVAAVVILGLCVGFLWRRRKHAAGAELKTLVGTFGALDRATGARGSTTTQNPTFLGVANALYENDETHRAGRLDDGDMPIYQNSSAPNYFARRSVNGDDDDVHDYENCPADDLYETIDRPTAAATATENDSEDLYEVVDSPRAPPAAIFLVPSNGYEQPTDNELYAEIDRPADTAPPRPRKGKTTAMVATDPADGEYDAIFTMGQRTSTAAKTTECLYTSDKDGQKCHNMVSGSSRFCPNHLCSSPACGNSKRSSEQRCASCGASQRGRELYVNTTADSSKKPGGIRRADRKGSVYDGFDEGDAAHRGADATYINADTRC